MRGAAGDQPLWIRDSGNAVAAHASADVENLHGVVSQRQLVFPVKAEMVEASLDTRHGNRFGQDPRSRRFGLGRSEEHTSELQSRRDLVCRLLLEKKKKINRYTK